MSVLTYKVQETRDDTKEQNSRAFTTLLFLTFFL